MKPKIGFFALTGCFGCLLSFLFNERELKKLIKIIDLKAFPFINSHINKNKFDFIFLEGLVASKEDIENVKKIRNMCKYLVAYGTCACTASVPAIRNFKNKHIFSKLKHKKIERLHDTPPYPISKYVKVEYFLPGCPPYEEHVVKFIKDIVLEKEPRITTNPVCFECRKNGNVCFLEKNTICLGPITKGGCNAICINNGFECFGCRGLTGDENIDAFINLMMDKGFKREDIINRIITFIGNEISEKYGDKLRLLNKS